MIVRPRSDWWSSDTTIISTVVDVIVHSAHGGYMAWHGKPCAQMHVLTYTKVDGGPFVMQGGGKARPPDQPDFSIMAPSSHVEEGQPH